MAERTTSFAKSVEGLHHEPSALDRARALRDQFNHAQEQNNERQKPREAEKPQEGEKTGSQMIREHAPLMHPAPNGPLRQAVDRQASAAKLSRERSAESQKNRAAEMARQFKARQSQSRDHERDRER
jgi:hypothetical protein